MKPVYRRYLFYVLLVVMGIVYFAPELNLLGKYVLNNGLSGSGMFSPRIRSLESSDYELLIDGIESADIDKEKSYILISGSRYGFVDTQEHYSYFLDKLVPVRKVSLNNSELIYSDSSVYASSLIRLPETYSAISEVYLYDNDGKLMVTGKVVGNTMFINDSLTVQVLSPNSLDPATLIQK